MAVDNRNRDRLQVTTQFLPDIPLEGSYALQNLLADMKSRLEELWTNPTPPAQPSGVTITANNLGNNVAWNIAANAARYQAFRNTSGDITSATMFRELPGNNNVSFFDPNDQTSALRYYWIRGVSAKGEAGPFSAMVSATNFYALNGTAVGVDAIAAGSNGTAVGKGADSGTGDSNTVVGVNSVISGGAAVDICSIVGHSCSIAGRASTAVGQGIATGTGSGNTAVGAVATTATGNTSSNVAVGAASSATGGSAVVIGRSAVGSAANVTTVGHSASVTAADATVIGQGGSVSGARSVGIGQGVTITHTDCVVIGKAGTSTANGQVLIGTASTVFTDIWFGRGATHTGAAQTTNIHVSDGTGTNITGDTLAFYPGLGTGSAVSGDTDFYYGEAGASGTTLNTAAKAMTIAAGSTGTVRVLTRFGVGDMPNVHTGIGIASTIGATGGVAHGLAIGTGCNLTAAANNDILDGILINPTFTDGAFTGVTHWGIRATTTAASLFHGSVTIGTTGTTSGVRLAAQGDSDQSVTIEAGLPSDNGNPFLKFRRNAVQKGSIYTDSGANLILSAGSANTAHITISSAGSVRFDTYGSGALTTDGSGNITATSDEREKYIQGSFLSGLDAIRKISPILYKWRESSGMETVGTYAGFSAQNVERAEPFAVGHSSMHDKLSLQDRALLAVCVNALKEIDMRVHQLEEEYGKL